MDEGQLLGKVDDIFNTGSNDIYVVKDELGKQILLPGIPDVLKDVDLEKGRITVHLIAGLEIWKIIAILLKLFEQSELQFSMQFAKQIVFNYTA